MYLTSTKANGRRYFYLAKYTGKKEHTVKKYENVYKFGNEKIALDRFSLWILDNSFIPDELLSLGVSIEDVKKWKDRVVEFIREAS